MVQNIFRRLYICSFVTCKISRDEVICLLHILFGGENLVLEGSSYILLLAAILLKFLSVIKFALNWPLTEKRMATKFYEMIYFIGSI